MREEPDDAYVHSRRVRMAVFGFVAVAAVLAGVIGSSAGTPGEYLSIWAASGLVFVPLAVVLARVGLREVAPDGRALRAWYAGTAALYTCCALVVLVGVHGWAPGKPLLPVVAVLSLAAFGTGNVLALKARSGQRAIEVDLSDVLVITVAVLGPIALVTAEPILNSPYTWLAVPAALFVVGGLHAIVMASLAVLRSSAPPTVEPIFLIAMVVASVLDGAALVAQCLTDFGLPPGPLVALHMITMSNGVITGACVVRGHPHQGLALLPPQRQVRRSGPLAGLVLASVVALVLIAAWRHDSPGTAGIAVGVLAGLVVLATWRQIGLAHETVRLYGAVERAADERRALLEEVMRYLDGDRTRAAAQIHRQAAQLYTSMALSGPADSVAGRVRVDLGRHVDLAQEVLTAMQTAPVDHRGLERFEGLIRAYVDVLCGDLRAPVLDVDIAEGLVTDWLDEAVAFRIVQIALHNVWCHAQADTVTVAVGERDAALFVEVVDDGVGFDPRLSGTGIVTLHALAQLVGGRVEIDSTPGAGTRVRAVLAGPAPAARPGGPRFRVISGGGTGPVRT